MQENNWNWWNGKIPMNTVSGLLQHKVKKVTRMMTTVLVKLTLHKQNGIVAGPLRGLSGISRDYGRADKGYFPII
jgi:hypothetical protein